MTSQGTDIHRTELAQVGPDTLALPDVDPLDELTTRWLANRRLSPHTREAYLRDVRRWLTWCREHQVDPLHAKFTHVNSYGTWVESTALPRGGHPPAPATVARWLSAVSEWYRFLVKLEVVTTNPVIGADRPRVDRDYSPTVSFQTADAARMLQLAPNDAVLGSACAPVLAGILVILGPRVSEVCGLDITDLGHDSGHRTVRLRMKGRKMRTRPLPAHLATLVDAHLAARAALARIPVAELDGPLLTDPRGRRLTRWQVYEFVRRLARAAGVPQADRITPHSFRHAYNTTARESGVPLEARQYSLGHADPRTTQRYDRRKLALDDDPAHTVAGALTGIPFPHGAPA